MVDKKTTMKIFKDIEYDEVLTPCKYGEIKEVKILEELEDGSIKIELMSVFLVTLKSNEFEKIDQACK